MNIDFGNLKEEQKELLVSTIPDLKSMILPGILIYVSFTGEKGLNKWTRRILFTSGLYTIFKDYKIYKKFYDNIKKQ